MKGQLARVKPQNARLISTWDSVEGISLGTDPPPGIIPKLDGLNSTITFILEKVRRR